jgi:SAM-dependent methyltransferase
MPVATPSQARQIISGMINAYLRCQLVLATAKLGIPDQLGSGPKSLELLANSLQVDSSLLRRFLRCLQSVGLVKLLADGVYELTALGEPLITSAPGSLRDRAMQIHDLDYSAWGRLYDGLLSGSTPFDHAFGAPLYTYTASRDSPNRLFNLEMAEYSDSFKNLILDAFDFSAWPNVLDVGGGMGSLLFALLDRHRNVTGTIFELPQVMSLVRSSPLLPPLADRISMVEGDFFTSVPSPNGLLVMEFVLHNWSDADCKRILRNCRHSMKADDRLLIVEFLAPGDEAWPNSMAIADMTMYVLCGGMERTEEQVSRLLTSTGFTMDTSRALSGQLTLLEASPTT